MQRKLFIDYETYSESDLFKVGQHFYSQHPSTKVLLMSYAFDEEPIKVVDTQKEVLPQEVVNAFGDPNILKIAHNASFEILVTQNIFGISTNLEQWHCTMVHALSLSLPGGLEKLCQILNLSEDEKKLSEGKALIRLFSIPNEKPKTEEHWLKFLDYSLKDVESLRTIYKKFLRYPMTETEKTYWILDQEINNRGLPIDRILVKSLLEKSQKHKEWILEKATHLTGLANFNSRNQLLDWLKAEGFEIEDLTSKSVKTLTEKTDLPESIQKILRFRQQLSRSSLAKIEALENGVLLEKGTKGAYGRLKGAFQFCGAGRTGRFAGRRFQPQNLPRPLFDESEVNRLRNLVKKAALPYLQENVEDLAGVFSSLLRSTIAVPPNKKLIVADYSSIESVILAWVSKCHTMLELYRKGQDVYKDFASQLFLKPYYKISKSERNLAKPAVLGCGYGLGALGLKRYAESFGMQLTEEEAKTQVQVFKNSYPEIPKLWKTLDQSLKLALMNKNSRFQTGKFIFQFDGVFLSIQLPSGRKIFYYHPKLELNQFGKESLTYAGRETSVRVWSHAGKLVENLVQGIARDVLLYGMQKAKEAGFCIVGHVHDEIICESMEKKAQKYLGLLIEKMTENPPWALDLPLKAEGYTSDFYKK